MAEEVELEQELALDGRGKGGEEVVDVGVQGGCGGGGGRGVDVEQGVGGGADAGLDGGGQLVE